MGQAPTRSPVKQTAEEEGEEGERGGREKKKKTPAAVKAAIRGNRSGSPF